MDIPVYESPAFLDGQAAEDVYERMREIVAGQIDTEFGSIFYHINFPVALEHDRMANVLLNEAIKAAFPQYAQTSALLDAHGYAKGIVRKGATKAVGTVRFYGIEGTTIPSGTKLSTASTGSTSALTFITLESAVIPSGGYVDVAVEAEQAGSNYNVIAGSIAFMSSFISGVTEVTNPSDMTGGSDEEGDEAFRHRILDIMRTPPGSGSASDYARWAMSVNGVGAAKCIPLWDGPGTVKVVILGTDGKPAAPAIVEAVQNYIAPADGTGMAPIGATVTVVAPTSVTVNYTLDIELQDGYELDDIIEAFEANLLTMYVNDVGIGGTVRLSRVIAALIAVKGVEDVNSVLINGVAQNLVLGSDEYPVTGTVTEA